MHIPEDEAERRRLNERGREILRRKNGAVRPHREDGYVNLLNKYGTKQDNSEAYKFEREPVIPDMQLTGLYEGNGLFSKIIDTPAEEALKHGFDLNLKSDELNAFVEDALDDLEWEEKAATAIKWARLYGGALIVMLIDDGRGLEEPVDWEHIRSIDELRVYERSIVQPDYASLYRQDYGGKGVGNRVSKFGQPEYYYVSSIYGSFKVHESRCLVFRNGVLPEQTSNATYLFWGMPEYVRIRRALRETVTAHTDSVKLLERSVQAIYSMKGLASLLTTDDGENQVLKRLQLVDTSRGLLNSIAIDSEGEQYDFKTFQFSGVKDVIDATCNMLSALTNIPQTILFGRSPAGMNATGDSDFESYYNFVEKIQRLMLKRNLRTLLDVVFRAGIASGDVAEEPDYKLEFKPLWSLSDTEQATVDQTKAQTALVKAQTAQAYVDMQALDPTEVRRRLASDEEFDVEDIISEDDEGDLLQSLLGTEPSAMSDVEAARKNLEQGQAPGGAEQTAPAVANADAENGKWVTVNGTHILIDENGVAQNGGNLKGETLKQAESKESSTESKKSKNHASASRSPAEYTSEIKKLSNKENYTKVADVVKDLPVGTVIGHGHKTYEKISENTWQYKDSFLGWDTLSNQEMYKVNGKDEEGSTYGSLLKVLSVPNKPVESKVSEKAKAEEVAQKEEEQARIEREELKKRKQEARPKSLEAIESAYKDYSQKNGGVVKNNTKTSQYGIIADLRFASRGQATDWLAEDLGVERKVASKYLQTVQDFTLDSEYMRESFMKQVDGDPGIKTAFALEDFIKRSPKCDKPIYRGISVTKDVAASIISGVSNGDLIFQNGPSSWSTKEDVARKFASSGGDYVGIVFEDEKTKHGVDISKASYKPEEAEVVVSGFTKHRGVIKSVNENTITISCTDVTDEYSTDAADTDRGVGVLVVQDGRFLCGTRLKGGSVGGPGGHIEAGESPEDAAIRETQEEFGITPKDLMPVAFLSDLKPPYCPSHVFLCTDFDGSIRCPDGEMTSPGFITAEKVAELSTQNPERLFPPFAQSITALLDVLSLNHGLTSEAQNAKMKDRMDFNEADHPRDENGQFAESEGSSSGSTESGPAVSPEGENASCKGFADPEKKTVHFTKHGAEFGFSTEDEYEAAADKFLQQPCGGDVIGYSTPKGKIVRFNVKTTEYASGFPGQNICTYMKPKCGSGGVAKPDMAMAYYNKFKEKDGV